VIHLTYTNWELKWFFKGTIPKEVEQWRDEKKMEVRKPRTDTYLLFQNCIDLGVKLSRGELQIKYCRTKQDFAPSNFSHNGIFELWSKCSLPLRDQTSMIFDGVRGSQLSVHKERYAVRYRIDLKEKTIEASHDKVDQGVFVEITKLNVMNSEWWTLGFDALDSDLDNQTRILRFGVRALLIDFHVPRLTKENSYSYPKWLYCISR